MTERSRLVPASLFSVGLFGFWASLYVHVPVLPLYARTVGASMTGVGLVTGAYGITQVLTRMPIGLVSDRWGRRKPFVLMGAAVAAIGSLVLVLSSEVWLLVLARATLGIAAATWVPSTVLFSSYFERGGEVFAISLVTFVSATAQIVATYAGGKIADECGLVAPFYYGIAIAAIAAAVLLRIPEETVRPSNSRSLYQFLKVARNRTVLKVSTIAALSQYASYTGFAFVPVHAEAIGASASEVGLLTAVSLASYTVATLSVASLSSRFSERISTLAGMLLLVAGTSAIPFLQGVSLLSISQIASGIGRGLSFPVLMALSIRGLPEAERASAMGFFQAIYALGITAGPFISGVLADSLGLDGAFLSTGMVCLFGVFLGLLL